MAEALLTTTDVAYFSDNDLNIVLSDVLDGAPLVARMAARTVAGNTFKYPKKTANPAVGFRAANDGREVKKVTRTQITATLAILDASFRVDLAVAKADERGSAALLATEAADHLRAALAELEQQIFYGTGNDANGFSGLGNQTNLDGLADAQVVSAGGSTAGTGSSCWLLRTGETDLQVLWGEGGEIAIGETVIQETSGSTTGTYPAYYTPVTAWAGLKVGSIYSAVRIANLTEDSGKGLTDTLIASAFSAFPADRPPNLIAMNRRSMKQLRASRTATNATGAPAPFPMDWEGIPIVVTDQILSTETLLA